MRCQSCEQHSAEFCRQCRDNAYDVAYHDGVRTGLAAYAWWKDGVQYVGTCGTTLKDALAKASRREYPPRLGGEPKEHLTG
jgi:hypothetical protein